MAPRNLALDVSLETLWSEVTYSAARLVGDPNAAEFAPGFEQIVSEVEQTQLGQRRMWKGEIYAQAQCDYVNGEMDATVIGFSDTLIFTTKDRSSARAKRYLRLTPYSIVRLGLKSEVEVVRSWPDSLSTEPEEALKAFAPRFREVIRSADAALGAQRDAQRARADHRVREIEPLIKRINGERFKLYGLLVGRAEEKGLGKYWPDGFFKVAQRRTSDELPEEEPASQTAAPS